MTEHDRHMLYVEVSSSCRPCTKGKKATLLSLTGRAHPGTVEEGRKEERIVLSGFSFAPLLIVAEMKERKGLRRERTSVRIRMLGSLSNLVGFSFVLFCSNGLAVLVVGLCVCIFVWLRVCVRVHMHACVCGHLFFQEELLCVLGGACLHCRLLVSFFVQLFVRVCPSACLLWHLAGACACWVAWHAGM
mmetsp:Transcript_1424/g.2941  ORF Transcript_1424/g.2941 Transcript_1424/m.2941 type:complete len:189 (+) Transcript_1424:578-1144(+)